MLYYIHMYTTYFLCIFVYIVSYAFLLQIIQEYPEITKPKFYRFLIHLPDASEYEALYVLELLRQHYPLFKASVWSVKTDKATAENKFGSLGHMDISRAVYRIGKWNVRKKIAGRESFASKNFDDVNLYGMFCYI